VVEADAKNLSLFLIEMTKESREVVLSPLRVVVLALVMSSREEVREPGEAEVPSRHLVRSCPPLPNYPHSAGAVFASLVFLVREELMGEVVEKLSLRLQEEALTCESP
jgi:hypothetical protein